MATNLFEGALLIIGVLLFLLGNWRAAFIVAAAIPLALLFAITGMTRFGISGNLMSLGAIDFGLIIDGAVVIVENVVRQLGVKQHELARGVDNEERLHGPCCKQASRDAYVLRRLNHHQCPCRFVVGIEGKMFHPMALTVMLALGGSLVLA